MYREKFTRIELSRDKNCQTRSLSDRCGVYFRRKVSVTGYVSYNG